MSHIKIRSYWLLSLIIILSVLSGICFFEWARLPQNLRLSPGQEIKLSVRFPFSFEIPEVNHPGVSFSAGLSEESTKPRPFRVNDLVLKSSFDCVYNINLRLFGAIPVKKLRIEVARPPLVVPGGQAIGVLFSSRGVIVVGSLPVRGTDHQLYHPAKDAGLEIGDIVLTINGIPVNHVEEVEYYLKSFQPEIKDYLELLVKRRGQLKTVRIKPVFCEVEDNKETKKQYMLGIYIEDPAAGVGTLTFYDPERNKFAGLGHRIANSGRRKGIPLEQGEIVIANINGIRAGVPGIPGEKIGVCKGQPVPVGVIEKNCRFGIFGRLLQSSSLSVPKTLQTTGAEQKPLPLAYGSELQKGPAEILTVIQGEKVERFKIEITTVYRQNNPRDKGMIITVTDPRLLQKTGGIIQGMSGSPIIQNGKLVGAVTHVFVNDPTRGYGVLAEWMYREIK